MSFAPEPAVEDLLRASLAALGGTPHQGRALACAGAMALDGLGARDPDLDRLVLDWGSSGDTARFAKRLAAFKGGLTKRGRAARDAEEREAMRAGYARALAVLGGLAQPAGISARANREMLPRQVLYALATAVAELEPDLDRGESQEAYDAALRARQRARIDALVRIARQCVEPQLRAWWTDPVARADARFGWLAAVDPTRASVAALAEAQRTAARMGRASAVQTAASWTSRLPDATPLTRFFNAGGNSGSFRDWSVVLPELDARFPSLSDALDALGPGAPREPHAAKAACTVMRTTWVALWAPGMRPVRLERVAVAADPASRARGLGGIASMGPLDAMLFVFPGESTQPFTMQPMRFDLDLAFVGADRVVLGLFAAAAAGSVVPIAPPVPYKFVLEAPAWSLARAGIAPGWVLTSPALL